MVLQISGDWLKFAIQLTQRCWLLTENNVLSGAINLLYLILFWFPTLLFWWIKVSSSLRKCLSLVTENALKCTCQEPQNKNCPLGGPRIPPIKGGNSFPYLLPHSSATWKKPLVGFKSVAAYLRLFSFYFKFSGKPWLTACN